MAQSQPPKHARAPLAIQAVQPRMAGALVLTSPAIGDDGRIDALYSADEDNLSPPLAWNPVLEAESFALIVEDPDAPGDEPFVHWMIWDIPGTATELHRGVMEGPYPQSPVGPIQGKNGHGHNAWFGPRPPAGHGVHRYHFQLFALSKRLGMSPNTGLPDLLNALKANTIASGELVGTFETKDPSNLDPPRTFAANDHGRGGLDEDDVDRHAPHEPDGVVRP